MRLGWREGLLSPATALVFVLFGVVPALAQAAPCVSIDGAVAQIRNLGAPLGDEQLSLRGGLADGADFSAAFRAGWGLELRLQDLGAGIGEAVFNLTASGTPGPRRREAECEPGTDTRTTRRGKTVRVYRRRGVSPSQGCESDPGAGSALLRLADGGDGSGIRFRLRTSSTELERPTGPLRTAITIGMGSGDQACATYTFSSEECELNDARTVLTCRSNQNGPGTEACLETGCSGQVCAERAVATTCEFLPHYACYRNAECARQSDGSCGWTPTEDLLRCIAEAAHVGPTPTPRPAPEAEWFACENDSDCVVIPGIDCCGCDFGGGPQVAINPAFRDEVDGYRDCGDDFLCPGEYLCRDDLTAVCRDGLCVAE